MSLILYLEGELKGTFFLNTLKYQKKKKKELFQTLFYDILNFLIYAVLKLFLTFVFRSYKLLSILEFSSSRKRMSVIVRNEEGKILLLSKGADRFVNSILFGCARILI